ncbi:MAG: sulfotransferase [Desulfobacterales bacterium]|nr:sulfotransferase [Desulfobacterales bacterium]
MNENLIRQPIFFIGMPRSGTTIIFEAVARHPELAWPSNYSQRNPQSPCYNLVRRLHENRFFVVEARKKQYAEVAFCNRYLVKPAEAYQFWDYYSQRDFSLAALGRCRADQRTGLRLRNAVAKIVRYQGRTRFSAKLTGPPRVGYLNSIFPDARFVHIVRDGLAVVHSLLNVSFWKEKGGYDGPFWQGVLRDEDIDFWRRGGKDPGVITALQWNRVLKMTRAEAGCIGPERLLEVKYEDFMADPQAALTRVFSFCNLTDAAEAHDSLARGPELVNMNHKYAKEWKTEYINQLTDIMRSSLEAYGYVTAR